MRCQQNDSKKRSHFRLFLALALFCGLLMPVFGNLALAEEPAPTDPAILVEAALLTGGWTHSYEEDAGFEGKVFRPSDSRKFPPSRFRNRYVFQADGSGKFMYLDPADRHRMMACRWELTKEEPPAIKITAAIDGKERVERLQILELTKDILRVK